jgi:hypothetical protein
MDLILGNGAGPRITADEARKLPEQQAQHLLEQALQNVDDDMREALHGAHAPCTYAHFLVELLAASDGSDLVIG